MMKQRLFALLFLSALLLTACGQTYEQTETPDASYVVSPAASSEAVSASAENTAAPDSAIVYLPDDNAEKLVATEVTLVPAESEAVADAAPELDFTAGITALVETLTAEKALPAGSAVLSVTQEDVLTLDMNAAFGDGLMSTGSTGETLYLGALVNTVLEYTGAERVLITVEGAPLETGHNIYDEPLGVINP